MDNRELAAIWPADKKFANITWQVSDVCNFSCSYCNPGNYGAKHPNIQTEQYIKVLEKMITQFEKQDYQYFKFFFSGGEPTIWPPLLEICRYLRKRLKNVTIAVNTNLSRSPDWWKKNYIYFDDVVASFHIEGCNQEVYLKNIDFLQYRLNYLACRILMHDGRFQEVVDFSERLKAFIKNGVIEYAALFEELKPQAGMYEYQEEWKREFIKNNTYFIKREIDFCHLNGSNKAYCDEIWSDGQRAPVNATRLISAQNNNFKNWKCWINDSIFIGPAGDIKLASCQMSQIVGHIHSDELNLLNEPVTCKVSSCGCGTDINIPKLNPAFEKDISRLTNV